MCNASNFVLANLSGQCFAIHHDHAFKAELMGLGGFDQVFLGMCPNLNHSTSLHNLWYLLPRFTVDFQTLLKRKKEKGKREKGKKKTLKKEISGELW